MPVKLGLIKISCIFDDSSKYFTPKLKKHIAQVLSKRYHNLTSCMSDSEIVQKTFYD